jgi:hypothetical protein
MSNLSRSFVRGFGGTLGVFAAKGLLEAAAKNPGYRIGGVSTKRQWRAIFYWIGITALLGFTLGSGPAVLFFFLGLIPIFLYQMWAQRRDDNREHEEERAILLSEIDKISEEAKLGGIVKFTLDWSGDVKNYHLQDTLNAMKAKLATANRLSKKYEGELLDKMLDCIPWLGMTKDNLIDMKGQPTQIERDENSRTITDVLIYGTSKRSGDVFTFKNGFLTEFKDR